MSSQRGGRGGRGGAQQRPSPAQQQARPPAAQQNYETSEDAFPVLGKKGPKSKPQAQQPTMSWRQDANRPSTSSNAAPAQQPYKQQAAAPSSWGQTGGSASFRQSAPRAPAPAQQSLPVTAAARPVAAPTIPFAAPTPLQQNQPATNYAASGDPAASQQRGRRTMMPDVVRTRPRDLATKMGNVGRKITVQCNYFRVLKKPKWTIYQYRVDFSPEIDNIRVCRAYLSQHKELLGGYIFDGTMLFCTTHLQQNPMELLTKNREGETIQIKIKPVGMIDVSDVQQLQVLNLILRRAMDGLNLQLVGRNYFDPIAKIGMPSYNLELWPGYQTSIRQHERDILLCADIAHKVMRTEYLYNILTRCLHESRGDFQAAFKREVIGTVVLTDYNNKTYRIDDVNFELTPTSKFATKNGEISYVDYYKQRYNLNIRDIKQPLLVSRPTEKNIRGGQNEFTMLIPELTRATGLNDQMRNDFRLMKAMAEYTRLVPEKRIQRLKAYNHRLKTSKETQQVFDSWNMQLDTNMVEIPARILPGEKILFGSSKTYVCDDRADWNQQLKSVSMFAQTKIERWHIVVPRRNVREAQTFIQMCIKAAKGMNMYMAEPFYIEMNDNRVGSYSQALDTAVAKDPQIVMVVLDVNNSEKYSCIKKKCCVDRPVASQVVTLRTIAPRPDKSSGLMSIATKVVIQMNAKLRGIPWMVDTVVDGLMTVGFDVCHSAKERNKSYGALVATMDMKKSSRYYSAVTEHLKGQELSNQIAMNMGFALTSYWEEHKNLPSRILFYRDGVGDGQLHQVVNTELQVLIKKLNEIYKSNGLPDGCKLTFIVVSKRINTRFFNRQQNPIPGTVVDDIVTLPERYDFYLVSQSVRQGTVSPTSYNVIYDTSGLKADHLQSLTYKFTHLYYNWSGTCRVPSVCQYAHKLAFLVAESIHRAPSNQLQNQLYFL